MVYICDGCGKTTMRIHLHDNNNLCKECYEKAMLKGVPTQEELAKAVNDLDHKLALVSANLDNLAKRNKELNNTINNLKSEIRKIVTERRK